eukprot:scaffold253220_cov36-Tisochrysis_lutea.AAC.3
MSCYGNAILGEGNSASLVPLVTVSDSRQPARPTLKCNEHPQYSAKRPRCVAMPQCHVCAPRSSSNRVFFTFRYNTCWPTSPQPQGLAAVPA